MLDVRDLTDHPAVASRVSAPQAAAALSGLGFVAMGHVEVPMTEPHSLRQVLVAADGLTVALLWTPQDKELVTLMSVLEDGTILETEILPAPRLLLAFFKPGYPGLGLRTGHGPAQLTESAQQHRRVVMEADNLRHDATAIARLKGAARADAQRGLRATDLEG